MPDYTVLFEAGRQRSLLFPVNHCAYRRDSEGDEKIEEYLGCQPRSERLAQNHVQLICD